MPLLGRNEASIGEGGQAVGGAMYGLNEGGADEDGVVGWVLRVNDGQSRDVEVCFKACDLPPERVPFDGNVHHTEQGLLATGIFGEEDCAGAGTPNRFVLGKLAEGGH